MAALDNPDLALSASLEAAAAVAQSSLASALNQITRRLRHYESEQDWVNTLMDGCQLFASTAAVFQVSGDYLHCRAARELTAPDKFEAKAYGAFLATLTSKEPVVALRTASEVGPALAAADRTSRAHLLPVLNGARVVAVLFATGNSRMSSAGLELLTALASMALERKSNGTDAIQIAPVAKKAKTSGLPAWTSLSEADRTAHVRAQRFARSTVASMLLLSPEAARAGVEQNDIYLFLKKEIDAAREAYRAQFATAPCMVDYLHLELLECAGDGDEDKLGAEYPGPLI